MISYTTAMARLAEEGFHFPVAIHGDSLRMADCLIKSDAFNLVIANRDHFSKVALGNGMDSINTKTSTQNAVKSSRGTTTLNMTNYRATEIAII